MQKIHLCSGAHEEQQILQEQKLLRLEDTADSHTPHMKLGCWEAVFFHEDI